VIGPGKQGSSIKKENQVTSKRFTVGGNEGIISMNNEDEQKAMKEGMPVGDFKHLKPHLNVGSIGHKTDLGRQMAVRLASGFPTFTDDTEKAPSKGMEGVVHINSGDDTDKITAALRAAAKAGAKMIVVDSQPLSLESESLRDVIQDEPFEYQMSGTRPKKQKMGAMTAMAMAGAMSGIGGLGLSSRQEKTMRKCALPGCEVMHSHNGGYCKAEHCKEHQAILKAKK